MATMNLRRDDGAGLPWLGEAPREDAPRAEDVWDRIPEFRLDPARLAKHRVVTLARHDPAHVSFDLLRTRLLQAMKSRGWSRVAITSPTKACGKTFVSANLALSLARRPSFRAVLMDLDLRIPSLARVLGISDTPQVSDFLAGGCPPEALLRRVAPNLAVGASSRPYPDSAELIQEPSTMAALDGMRAALRPDIVLYDLPPALACDDVIAFLPQVDGVLLVAAAGTTSAAQVQECERLFAGQTPLLGIILNKSEDATIEPYYS